MNWDAIGAIGEIFGALAVVLSLIYLATQIRVSNRAARNSAHQELMDQFLKIYSSISSTTETADIFNRGIMDDESLSQAEKTRFGAILQPALMVWERLYHLAAQGEIDSWLVDNITDVRSQIVGSPGFQSWFEDRKLSLSEEFRAVIEEEMKQSSETRLLGLRIKVQNASE